MSSLALQNEKWDINIINQDFSMQDDMLTIKKSEIGASKKAKGKGPHDS